MRYLKFLLPLLVVVLLDLLFQLGLWEPVASPESHAGMSITKKLALQDDAFNRVDFVALGSSRPVYGIDHALFARIAAEHGYTYANLTVPGTHWMSVGAIADWLARTHPEVRGGVIALSVQDFLSPGNGTYELGIAYPFRRFGAVAPFTEHVGFDWHNPATYGLYSGLFEYHEDVQELLAHPLHRRKALRYFRALTPEQVLHGDADVTTDMCSMRIEQLQDCTAIEQSTAAQGTKLGAQCKQLQTAATGRYDLRPFLADQPLTSHLQQTRDIIRTELSALRWPIPPLVVLMPMPSIWAKDVIPQGTHEWALSVLQPLVVDRKIRVLDLTDLFVGERGPECSMYFDLYHNNVAGRERVMRQLMPELEQELLKAQVDARASFSEAQD